MTNEEILEEHFRNILMKHINDLNGLIEDTYWCTYTTDEFNEELQILSKKMANNYLSNSPIQLDFDEYFEYLSDLYYQSINILLEKRQNVIFTN